MSVAYNKKTMEICIDINIDISKVDHYTWFPSRIFRLTLEITFLLNKYFFLQMAYEVLSQNRKLKGGGDAYKGHKSTCFRFGTESMQVEVIWKLI